MLLLLLKLLLVPSALLALSLVGRHFGPAVAGWLAGLPVVAGPILLVLALENGADFSSTAAISAMAAVFASVAFSLSYAHAARKGPWFAALPFALLAWLLAVSILAALPSSFFVSLAVALGTLLAAPRAFPAESPSGVHRDLSRSELALRMCAGAALTVAASAAASSLGGSLSGLLAVFPVLGIVLAVFSHRASGAPYVSALLRAMAKGLYSFVAFCAVLSLALKLTGIPAAFALAAAASIVVQVATKRRLSGN